MSKIKVITGMGSIGLGLILILLDIALIFPTIFFIGLGIGLIIFRKDERVIEQIKNKPKKNR